MEVTNNVLAVLVILSVVMSMASTISYIYLSPEKPRQITGMAQTQGTGIANVTLEAEANIKLIVDVIEFGSLSGGSSNDTTNFSPYPFRLKNNGSAHINVSIAEDSNDLFWDRDNFCEDCFQFNATPCNDTTEAYWYAPWTDFNDSYEHADFVTMDTDPPNLVFNLSNYEGPDENYIFIHIKITVPPSESSGLKETNVFFKAGISS